MLRTIDIQRLKFSVSWTDLLFRLGFENVNAKTRRACCLLHGGNNGSSFSWTDKAFYCYTCGDKGDKIDLVQQVKHLSFAEAINFLESISGLKIQSQYKRKEKAVNYENLDFPVLYVKHLARKAERDYFAGIVQEIENEIQELTSILISLKNDNLPEMENELRNHLIRLDTDLIYWTHQGRDNEKT